MRGPVRPPEGAGAGVLLPEQEGEGERGQQQRLQPQAGERAQRGFFPQQPIGAECDGEGEGDPRQPADPQQQQRHAQRGATNGEPLHGPQPLVQDQSAERDIDQRHEEVPEARLEHMAMVHAPDIDQPVDRQQPATEGVPPDRRARPQGGAQLGQTGARRRDDEHKAQRPHVPVGDQLRGIHLGQLLPVERKQPPKKVTGRGGARPAPGGRAGAAAHLPAAWV